MAEKFKVMITGSFDPITLGHLDIIKRAAGLFDEVMVVMFVNSEKKYMFTEQQRFELMKKACADLDNVTVDFSHGMVIDYATSNGISAIIRGIRGNGDISYEKQMAEFNCKHSGIETLIMTSKTEFEGCSSTLVRSIIKNGGELSRLLPGSIIDDVKNFAVVNTKA